MVVLFFSILASINFCYGSGKKGLFIGASGLRIVYLSGNESPAGLEPCPKHCFSRDDINTLVSSLNAASKDYNGVDLLLTSVWPKGVTAHGNAPVSRILKFCLAKFTGILYVNYTLKLI